MKKRRKKRPHFTWQPKIAGEAAIGLATLFGCIRLYLEVLGQFWWDHFGLAGWICSRRAYSGLVWEEFGGFFSVDFRFAADFETSVGFSRWGLESGWYFKQDIYKLRASWALPISPSLEPLITLIGAEDWSQLMNLCGLLQGPG
jgi:hypothetical protein